VAKVAKVRRQAARQAAGINPRAISGSYDQQIRIVIAKKKPSIQYGKQTQLILGGASANHFNLDSFSSETPPSPDVFSIVNRQPLPVARISWNQNCVRTL
jgi:hypothetical protein